MRKLTSSLVGTSLLAVALSIVAVGVVWAGSSARQFFVDDSTETTVPTEGEIPDLIPDDSLPPSEVLELIKELTATVAELEEKVDAYESDIQAARTDAAKARAAADAAVADIDAALQDAAAATAAANDAKARVAQFEKRLSKLNDEGVYTGTVTPAQLSRRLAPADINGDWPLDRTSGELNGDKVKVSGSNCWSDYRYNIFVVPETFRGLSCLRVLK
jgi:hypothetical protein